MGEIKHLKNIKLFCLMCFYDAIKIMYYLEVTTLPDNWQRTNNHDCQDDDQSNSSWVGNTANKTKNSRFRGEKPISIIPRTTFRTNLTNRDIHLRNQRSFRATNTVHDQGTFWRNIVPQVMPIGKIQNYVPFQ
jgi:hypothetical protein